MRGALLAALALGACSSEPLASVDSREASARPVLGTRRIHLFDGVEVSSDPEATHYQHATHTIDWGAGTVSRATLHLALQSPCFPFDKWSPDTVPPGENWPTLCDAFDRGLLVSLDDPKDAEGATPGPPGLELVRAITPFGGPLELDVDMTDIVNARPGGHSLGVDIGTYGDADGLVTGTKGEWIVSATVELVDGPAPRRVVAVLPLVFGSVTEASPEPVAFTIPEGVTRGVVEYRATGHGAADGGASCIGPAEEFCRREHVLMLDGVTLDEFSPWRNDCATLCTPASYESSFVSIAEYCAENPCGAPASVRASRANWCPGSVTPPRVVESAELSVPGEHLFAFGLDELASGGSWLVSATYYGYE